MFGISNIDAFIGRISVYKVGRKPIGADHRAWSDLHNTGVMSVCKESIWFETKGYTFKFLLMQSEQTTPKRLSLRVLFFNRKRVLNQTKKGPSNRDIQRLERLYKRLKPMPSIL